MRTHHDSARKFRAVAAVSAAALTVGLAAGCSAATHDQSAIAAPQTSKTSPRVGEDDYYRVTMTIKNNSNQVLHVNSASLGHEDGSDGGHWDARPGDLASGTQQTISAYSAIQGQSISVTYEGESSHLQVRVVGQDPAVGSNNTNGTKAQSPLGVNASISSGRHCTATFTISGIAG